MVDLVFIKLWQGKIFLYEKVGVKFCDPLFKMSFWRVKQFGIVYQMRQMLHLQIKYHLLFLFCWIKFEHIILYEWKIFVIQRKFLYRVFGSSRLLCDAYLYVFIINKISDFSIEVITKRFSQSHWYLITYKLTKLWCTNTMVSPIYVF